jgi:hypothetical protein
LHVHSVQSIRHCQACLVDSVSPALVAILAGGAGHRIGGAKPEPLACGIYGEVIEPGAVWLGDAVALNT